MRFIFFSIIILSTNSYAQIGEKWSYTFSESIYNVCGLSTDYESNSYALWSANKSGPINLTKLKPDGSIFFQIEIVDTVYENQNPYSSGWSGSLTIDSFQNAYCALTYYSDTGLVKEIIKYSFSGVQLYRVPYPGGTNLFAFNGECYFIRSFEGNGINDILFCQKVDIDGVVHQSPIFVGDVN